MTVYEEFMSILDQAIEKAGNANKLAVTLGLSSNIIHRWKNEKRMPGLEKIQPILDYMGISLFSSKQPTSAELLAENSDLRARVKQLEEENAALVAYKHKWEGHLESLQAASAGESCHRNKKAI